MNIFHKDMHVVIEVSREQYQSITRYMIPCSMQGKCLLGNSEEIYYLQQELGIDLTGWVSDYYLVREGGCLCQDHGTS